MTIREYFDSIEDLDEREDAEFEAWGMCEADDGSFIAWATLNGILLDAIDERTGEYVVDLWAWDMCGD